MDTTISDPNPDAPGDDATTDPDEQPADPDAPVRGRIRGPHLRRVTHGVGLSVVDGLSAADERLRDLKAFLAVAPKSAVLTSLTGAELMGWSLPKMPTPAPVFIATNRADRRPRRQGLVCHRVTRVRRRQERAGLPVDEPEEILLAASRDVERLDLLILVESAAHHGDVDRGRMTELLDSGRPGVRNLRWAWSRANPKAESVGETLLYELHRCLEVDFEPQAEIYDDDGHYLGRADLRVTGTNLLHEYDGKHHRRKEQQRVDLRRGRGFAGSAYQLRAFTLDDLLNHPLVVMHEIDRALDRPHRMHGAAAWRELVKQSLYSDTGRARIMHRWRRGGGPDLTDTA
jgi:very-short-patch-repair endonuclease